MISSMRTMTGAALVVAGLLSVPAAADAQARRAEPRVVPARPAVNVGVYHGPRIYRSWYPAPYYYAPFYSPYYGFYGYYGYGSYGPWYPPYYYGAAYAPGASLRLQVTPREAQVFVDGYFAGTVDDFDGVFQRLYLKPGEHDLQVYLPGHRTLEQKVYLQPGKTFTVKQPLQTLQPGEPEPTRPVATNPPSRNIQARGPRDGVRDRDNDETEDGIQQSSATRAEFGSLAVRVQPNDASISIDGDAWQPSGTNERLILQLGAGVHKVEIRKDGYRAYITEVTIRPDDTTALNVALTPNQ